MTDDDSASDPITPAVAAAFTIMDRPEVKDILDGWLAAHQVHEQLDEGGNA